MGLPQVTSIFFKTTTNYTGTLSHLYGREAAPFPFKFDLLPNLAEYLLVPGEEYLVQEATTRN